MKTLMLTIKNCSECPYLDYDANYGISFNSGYDCRKTGERISTDRGSEREDLTKKEIPSWCPLPGVGGHDWADEYYKD